MKALFRIRLPLTMALLLLWLAAPLMAGNGHLLHGVGAINSSLGGAGTGIAFDDPIGAVHANPALLTSIQGTAVGLSTEFFKDDLSVTTFDGTTAHTTDSDGEVGVLPAVAWAHNNPNKRSAFGWGLLAVAGFRTNWPADPNSLLLAPQPNGFGKLNTELQVTKVPFAWAYQVNERLSVGASFNFYLNRLIVNPLPVVAPDCSPGATPGADPICYRPSTGVMVSEFGTTFQGGLHYRLNDRWSLGLSYTSELDTDPYEWNSSHANPNITSGPDAFGNPRRIAIDLDQPPIASFGLGYQVNQLRVAFDVRWVGYADTQGIGGTGGISELGELISIGWDDILIYMLGLELQQSERLTLRFGININDTPIREAVALNSGGTPSVFEEHYTLGFSYKATPKLSLDAGFYYTPENDVTGPFIGLEDQGATITLTDSIVSGLVGFSFRF